MSYFVDTHCHLDDHRYFDDLDSVMHATNAAGVEKIIIPGASIATLKRAVEIAQNNENVFFAVGIHPNDISQFSPQNVQTLRDFIKHEKCVAVGECGLDYYYFDKDLSAQEIEQIKAQQAQVFRAQIELALEFEKPLIVHIREASNDAHQILKSYENSGLRGVLHCYNADRILLDLSENFYYGIGGVATFKNARRLIEALPLIPQNRLVLETDAPYLTPEPHRGTRNSPQYIPLIAQKVAQVLNIDAQELQNLTTKNATDLFRI